MVLKYGTIFPPHDIAQLKPQLFLEVIKPILPDDGIPIRVAPVHFRPRPELLHHPESPLITRQTSIYLLEL